MKSQRVAIVIGAMLFGGVISSGLVVSCIDVGHEAETGCLADRTLPGCSSGGGSKGTSRTLSSVGNAGSDSGGAAGGTE
jgi:hypothetical protein